jgi:hypothetical protein
MTRKLTADAGAFRLPAIREKPRARLHEFLRVIQEMLGIFGHHLKSPTAPYLVCSHCVRDRTGCRELRDKFGRQIGLRLYAVKPLPVCLLKIVELLSLSLGKFLETLHSSSCKLCREQIEWREFFRLLAVSLRHDTPHLIFTDGWPPVLNFYRWDLRQPTFRARKSLITIKLRDGFWGK